MSRRGIKLRPAWEERFHLPARAELLDAFGKQQRHLLDVIRQRLLALPSVEESLAWRGIPWRWSFCYAIEGETDRPWAYLIPQPAKPIFALPVPTDMLESLPLRRLSRPVRDGLLLSTRVGGIHWPQWELAGRQQVEELLLLAVRKHELLLATA